MADQQNATVVTPQMEDMAKWLGVSLDDLKTVGREQIANLLGMVLYQAIPRQSLRVLFKTPKLFRSMLGGIVTLVVRAVLPEKKDWAKDVEGWITDIIGALTTLAEADKMAGDTIPAEIAEKKAPAIGKFFSNLAKLTQAQIRTLNVELGKLTNEGAVALLLHFVEVPEAEQQAFLTSLITNPETLKSFIILTGIRMEDPEGDAKWEEGCEKLATFLWRSAGEEPPATGGNGWDKLGAVINAQSELRTQNKRKPRGRLLCLLFGKK